MANRWAVQSGLVTSSAHPDGPETTAHDTLDYALRELPPASSVTLLLIGLNAAVFLAMISRGVHVLDPSIESLLLWGADFGPRTIGEGEWWRMLSAMFVHVGVLHLAVNMLALWSGGPVVERMVGSASYLSLYLVSGVFGNAVSLAVNPAVPSAGASGAVFGVYGALVGFLIRHPDAVALNVLRGLRNSAIAFVGFNLIYGFMAEHVDMGGHLGGLIAGCACGLALSRPLTKAALHNRGLRAAGVALAGAAAVVAFMLFVPQNVTRAEAQVQAWGVLRERQRSVARRGEGGGVVPPCRRSTFRAGGVQARGAL